MPKKGEVMSSHRLLPWLAFLEDGARPVVLWPAVVVVLAAAWLAGDPQATAQTIAASEPLIVEEDLPDPESLYELPQPRGGFADGDVVEFYDLPSEFDSAGDPGQTACSGACDDYPPGQARRRLRRMRRRQRRSCEVADGDLSGWQMPPLPGSPQDPGCTACGAAGNLYEPGGLLDLDSPYRTPASRLIASTHDRLWFHSEFLLWWSKGANMPALATTSPIGTAQGQAGVLGAPGTSLLFGNQAVGSNARPGGRFTTGWWLSPCHDLGIEATYLFLGATTVGFHASDQAHPILAQPFLNAQTGAQDASLVAYPGVESGTLGIMLQNKFNSLETLIRKAFVLESDYRADFLFGFRYARFAESLNVNSRSTTTAGSGITPAGTVTNISDFFGASNQFFGGELGVATQSRRGRWSVDLQCKVALGYSQSSVSVLGQTATTVPSQAPVVYQGGLLALPTNIGGYGLGGFGVIPELGATLEYQVTRRLSATFGYRVLYWSRVARPADQVDLNINPSQFPPGQLTGPAAPQFQSVITDFWVQGLTAGLKYRF